MPHLIREQRIRQRLNWFQKAQELGSVNDACVSFGISRKTYYNMRHRYAASQWDRLRVADRSRQPHAHLRQVGIRMARRLRRWRQRTGYGPRRLRWHLQRTGLRGVPSVYGFTASCSRRGCSQGTTAAPRTGGATSWPARPSHRPYTLWRGRRRQIDRHGAHLAGRQPWAKSLPRSTGHVID